MNPSTPDIRNSDVNEAINQALEVASPECFSAAQSDTTGMAITASVDVPEEIKFASGIVMVETREAHNLEVAGSNPVPATNFTDGVIYDEHLALALDEGQNSSNAWRLHDHVNHGLDVLVKRVEGVMLRAKTSQHGDGSRCR